MFLKNYTSNVHVSETIHKIEKVLIRCGVTGIMKEYGIGGKVVAITFQIDSSESEAKHTIRLPADEEKALEALWLDYIGDDLLPDGKIKWSSRKRKPKQDFADQAKSNSVEDRARLGGSSNVDDSDETGRRASSVPALSVGR